MTTKNGKKVMQYKKHEDDVKYEELKKLIESAYACFDTADLSTNLDLSAEDVESKASNSQPKKKGQKLSKQDQNLQLQREKSKVCCIIEMFEKVMKIKKLMKQANKSLSELIDFKFFIRTNKNLKRARQT